jgi:hypothetical protein
MATLYTAREVQKMLQELRIQPIRNGLVTTREVAAILKWRAETEQGTEHTYPESAVRRHVERGNLTVADTIGKAANLFRVEDVMLVPLTPKRGLKQQKVK